MARRPPRTFRELVIGLIGAILTSVIMYFGATHAIKRIGDQTQENLANIQQGILAKQQQQVAIRQQPASDPFDAQVVKAAAESKRKHDAAWSSYYQPPKGCDVWKDDMHMVECVNHKMRAKGEFEHKWAAGEFDQPQG